MSFLIVVAFLVVAVLNPLIVVILLVLEMSDSLIVLALLVLPVTGSPVVLVLLALVLLDSLTVVSGSPVFVGLALVELADLVFQFRYRYWIQIKSNLYRYQNQHLSHLYC